MMESRGRIVRNRAFLLLAFSGLLLLGFSVAFAKEIETTAEGSGPDQNSALADALARAVAQVNGVRASLNVSTGKVELTERSTRTEASATTTEESKAQLGVTPDATLRAQGAISRYEILNSETLADGSVRVSVRAFVHRAEKPTYSAPGSHAGKKRVAVFPVAARAPSFDFFGYIDADELASELALQLESSFLDTGAVSLLDRRSLGATLVELGLVDSRLTSDVEKAKLRQFRGADIVVLTSLEEARHVVSSWELRSTGQRRTSVDMLLEVNVRAVVPATGELLLTRKISVGDAPSRSDALAQAAELASYDVVRVLTGKSPAYVPRQGSMVSELPEATEPAGPRRSGVRLPIDP